MKESKPSVIIEFDPESFEIVGPVTPMAGTVQQIQKLMEILAAGIVWPPTKTVASGAAITAFSGKIKEESHGIDDNKKQTGFRTIGRCYPEKH